jgi:hypothetical protein
MSREESTHGGCVELSAIVCLQSKNGQPELSMDI